MRDDETILTEIGKIENSCPYCSENLPSRPVRKIKCPSCGAFIYVRTRPLDRQQVLVTQEDAKLIDEQRHIVASVYDGLIYDQKLMDTTRKNLKKTVWTAAN